MSDTSTLPWPRLAWHICAHTPSCFFSGIVGRKEMLSIGFCPLAFAFSSTLLARHELAAIGLYI